MLISSLLNISERLKGIWLKITLLCLKLVKLPFKLTAHVLRRTKASIMHEHGADDNTISMVLDNTPKTVMNHYIISSNRKYDACDIADCAVNGYYC